MDFNQNKVESENKVESQSIVESRNSVEMSVNAKGQWSGKVKSYAPTIEEAYNKTKAKAEELEKLIKDKNV